MNRRFAEADLRRMVKLYQQGYSTTEIAEAAECARSYVRYVLVRRGVKMRPRYRQREHPVTPKTVKKAGRLYTQGLTFKKLGDKLGCSHSFARTLVLQAGVKPRPRGRQVAR